CASARNPTHAVCQSTSVLTVSTLCCSSSGDLGRSTISAPRFARAKPSDMPVPETQYMLSARAPQFLQSVHSAI
ncbi:hypothetical protein NDU88_005643, partial [Pleurodeles waltl]